MGRRISRHPGIVGEVILSHRGTLSVARIYGLKNVRGGVPPWYMVRASGLFNVSTVSRPVR
jgi:hypothetical protein